MSTAKSLLRDEVEGIVGIGAVVGINSPGNPSADSFTVENGYAVDCGGSPSYTAKKTTRSIRSGISYGLIMVTDQATGTQLFIAFSGLESLGSFSTVVQGVGTTNQPVQDEDEVTISTQPNPGGGGIEVTVDVVRLGTAVATFSFVKADA